MGGDVVANSRLYSYSFTSRSPNKMKIDGSIQKIQKTLLTAYRLKPVEIESMQWRRIKE